MKKNNEDKKWYQRDIGVLILTIIFFPVGVYLMWKNHNFDKKWRVIISFAVLIFYFFILSNEESQTSFLTHDCEWLYPNKSNVLEDYKFNKDGSFSYSTNYSSAYGDWEISDSSDNIIELNWDNGKISDLMLLSKKKIKDPENNAIYRKYSNSELY